MKPEAPLRQVQCDYSLLPSFLTGCGLNHMLQYHSCFFFHSFSVMLLLAWMAMSSSEFSPKQQTASILKDSQATPQGAAVYCLFLRMHAQGRSWHSNFLVLQNLLVCLLRWAIKKDEVLHQLPSQGSNHFLSHHHFSYVMQHSLTLSQLLWLFHCVSFFFSWPPQDHWILAKNDEKYIGTTAAVFFNKTAAGL